MKRLFAFFLIAVMASAIGSCSKIEPELFITSSPYTNTVPSYYPKE